MNNGNVAATYLALCGMALFWGLSFVATKVALETFTTFTLVFTRFALASVIFGVLLARKGLPSFTRGEHIKMLLTAIFEPGFYFIFETYGLQYTTAPKASLIIAATPLAVAAFAMLFLREPTGFYNLMGILVSLVGIALLVFGDHGFNWAWEGQMIGDMLICGAVVSAALYMVIARDLGKRHSSLQITCMQIMYGAILYLPAFLWEAPAFEWAGVSARSAIALGYLTLFATVTAFLCYNYALTQFPASRAALFINGIPVVTAVGAWILLDEVLTPAQVLGGALVIGAVFLSNLAESRRARAVAMRA